MWKDILQGNLEPGQRTEFHSVGIGKLLRVLGGESNLSKVHETCTKLDRLFLFISRQQINYYHVNIIHTHTF